MVWGNTFIHIYIYNILQLATPQNAAIYENILIHDIQNQNVPQHYISQYYK